MFITNPDVERYIEKLTRLQIFDEDVLREMEDYGEKVNFPIVGRQVGVFLYLIAKLKKPKLVVEMGSGYGYSAYWFAKGMESGKVVLTDFQDRNISKAKEYFKRVGLEDRAEFRVGDAVEIAKEYRGIDILFLDLEKVRYLDAIKIMENNLSEGSLVLADNVLWGGQVLKDHPDKKTTVIKEFNRYMFGSGKFVSQIVPIRDGILLSIKL